MKSLKISLDSYGAADWRDTVYTLGSIPTIYSDLTNNSTVKLSVESFVWDGRTTATTDAYLVSFPNVNQFDSYSFDDFNVTPTSILAGNQNAVYATNKSAIKYTVGVNWLKRQELRVQITRFDKSEFTATYYGAAPKYHMILNIEYE